MAGQASFAGAGTFTLFTVAGDEATSFSLTIRIVGVAADGSVGSFLLHCAAKAAGGVVTLVGQSTISAIKDVAGWGVAFDISSGLLRCRVTQDRDAVWYAVDGVPAVFPPKVAPPYRTGWGFKWP